jgi:hypothetical protein
LETTLLHFAKAQLEHWFNYNDQKPLDDSEFVPLLDMLIDSFVHAGLSAASVGQLRRHACEVYHRYCQQTEIETTFEENLDIMFSYLPPPLRSRWLESLD